MTIAIPGIEGLVEVGRGGFAVVYRGHQAAFGRDVAVKVLTTPGLDEAARSRFARECVATGKLSWHPNVVQVYDQGTTAEGYPYLIEEYLERGSLAGVVRERGPLPPWTAVGYGVQVAAALESAHEAGLLHRDVKPENVLLDRAGHAKLADFGIAGIDGSDLTATGVFTASVAYAAPELFNGERPTVASDIYSLGAMLFCLLAGHPPFVSTEGGNLVSLALRVAKDAPADLRVGGVPDAIAEVVERAMAKDPADRFASAQELGHALQGCERTAGRSVTALVLAEPEPAQPGPAESAADQTDLDDDITPTVVRPMSTDEHQHRRVDHSSGYPPPRPPSSYPPPVVGSRVGSAEERTGTAPSRVTRRRPIGTTVAVLVTAALVGLGIGALALGLTEDDPRPRDEVATDRTADERGDDWDLLDDREPAASEDEAVESESAGDPEPREPQRSPRIAIGDQRTGFIPPEGSDTYSIRGDGRRVVITVAGTYAEGGLDPTVSVTDREGVQLGFDDDGGNEIRDSRLAIDLMADTTYWITVAGFSTSTGDYTLRVRAA